MHAHTRIGIHIYARSYACPKHSRSGAGTAGCRGARCSAEAHRGASGARASLTAAYARAYSVTHSSCRTREMLHSMPFCPSPTPYPQHTHTHKQRTQRACSRSHRNTHNVHVRGISERPDILVITDCLFRCESATPAMRTFPPYFRTPCLHQGTTYGCRCWLMCLRRLGWHCRSSWS